MFSMRNYYLLALVETSMIILLTWSRGVAVAAAEVASKQNDMLATSGGFVRTVVRRSSQVVEEGTEEEMNSAVAEAATTAPEDALVVCVTSIPPGIYENLPKVLKALMRQDKPFRPMHLYVAVPKTVNDAKVEFDIEAFYQSLPRTPKHIPQRFGPPVVQYEALKKITVEAELVDDIGPATRVLGAIKYGATHPVVLIDDDWTLWSRSAMKKLVLKWRKLHEKSNQTVISNEKLLYHHKGTNCVGFSCDAGDALGCEDDNASPDRLDELAQVDSKPAAFGQAYAGMLLPPGFITDDFVQWVQSLPKFCSVSDDYLYGVWAARRGYEVMTTGDVTRNRRTMASADKSSQRTRWLDGDSECGQCAKHRTCSAHTVHYERCRVYLEQHVM
jgi:hypothetical protein